MAATIFKELGAQPKLIEGARGVFDVAADGVLVFSRDRAGRFPDEDEIVSALRDRA